jgi:hypothetical protein
MPVLTDFLVDRFFPLEAQKGSEPVAWVAPGGAAKPYCVGLRKPYPGGGQAVCLGFRPRDDQSASTGQEARAWFEILNALGAYPGADHPAVISRSTRYVACSFANGALALAPHYRLHTESWPGGFFRDEAVDRQVMLANPLPDDDQITLDGMAFAGQQVIYQGRHCVAWRRGADGRLLAFAGLECSAINLDGREYRWSQQPVDVAWHPLEVEGVDGIRPLFRIWVGSSGSEVRLPLDLPAGEHLELRLGAHIPSGRLAKRGPNVARTPVGYAGRSLPFAVEDGCLVLRLDESDCEHWLYLLKAPAA